jgi:hypothetical protein
MPLTGLTIGQLTALDYTTNNLLIPVEESGTTYHIAFSGINYTEATYTGLTIASSAGGLVPGQFYLMTDFQTCYDQPNYTNEGAAITTGNYKTGSTEPILLLATSTTGFSPTVYSTIYRNDKITYDFTWNTTEVTSSPAKGRITERIDRFNNRADYDFRAVQFIRYQAFLSEDYYTGTVSIDGSGNVVGVGTDFINDFSVGQILGIHSPNYSNLIGGFAYYEILTIPSVSGMTVTGTTFYTETNKFYSRGISGGVRSPFQCNVPTPSYTGSSQYYTFNSNQNFNTYLGDNQNYNDFILSNNVFLSGNYEDMTFGGNVVSNTFDNFMTSTTCAPFFQFNIITNNFDRSTIGPDFKYNFIECDFQGNTVVANFQYNMLGDNDGSDFDYNQVGWGFRNNFFTFSNDDFIDNTIGNDFNQNLIHYGFARNVVGTDFANNRIISTFNDNQISNNFNNNSIYSLFNENVFGENVNTNTFGDPNDLGFYSFTNNNIAGNFTSNYFSGTTQYNTIGNGCNTNNVDTFFSYNQIGTDFYSNTISASFGGSGVNYKGNIIGNAFHNNIVGPYFHNNRIADLCYSNNFGENFINNVISYGMYNTTTVDLDNSGAFQNNIFPVPGFNMDLTLSGGTGGNPIFYNVTNTNVSFDVGTGFSMVTYLSGGTFTVESLTV